jgi:HK97 family phage portal protein
MWPFSKAPPKTKSWSQDFSTNNSTLSIENLFSDSNVNSASSLNEAMACIRVKSNAVSQCPVIIEKRLSDGTYVSASDAGSETMKNLMLRPTSILTWQEWLSLLVQNVELKGNFSTFNRFNLNEPVSFEPFFAQGGVNYSYDSSRGVKTAVFVTNNSQKMQTDFPDRRLSHFMNLHTWNGIKGYSTLTAAALNMGLLEQSFMSDLLTNYDAPSSGFIEMPEGVEASVETIAAFKENVTNNKGLTILSDGAKFNSTRMSPVDLALIESKTMNRESICALYGIPVGLISPSTNANNDDLLKLHSLTIAPLLNKIEQNIQAYMPEGWRFRLDDSAFTRGDYDQQVENESKLIQRGLSTLGESADRLGIPCSADRKDLLAIETNNIQLGTAEYILEVQELNNAKLRAEITAQQQPKETPEDESEKPTTED